MGIKGGVPLFLPRPLSLAQVDGAYLRKNTTQLLPTDKLRLGAAPSLLYGVNVDASSFSGNVWVGKNGTVNAELNVGAANGALFGTTSVDALTIETSGVVRWAFLASGQFKSLGSNAQIIGGVVDLALRDNANANDNINVTDAGNVTARNALACGGNFSAAGNINAGAAQLILWQSSSIMSAPSDGIILFRNNAGGSFNRLQIGGVTAAFPALSRNSTGLSCRLADDSNYSSFSVSSIQFNTPSPFISNVSLTNGAGASIATITNGPVAGNPTKWMPFNDNGTIRYIPMW